MTDTTAPASTPRGPLPKGSAYGLVALGILTGVIPFFIMQSLVPVLRNGTAIWLGSLLPALGASGVVGLFIGLGLARRSGWYIGAVFASGCLMLAAYAFGVTLGAAILFGLVPEVSPDLSFLSVVNIICWLLMLPLAWLLLRLVRLRYWQPWTTQIAWEAPDDVRPPRTLLMSMGRRKNEG